MNRLNLYLIIFLTSLLLLTACGTSSPAINIEDAWIRPDPLWENAAGYFTLTNDGGQSDTLLGVSISISASESVHQTVMEGDVHKMLPVEQLEIAPGETVVFQPMSYHVMLMGLESDLDYGQTANMIFSFEKTGQVEVIAELRAE